MLLPMQKCVSNCRKRNYVTLLATHMRDARCDELPSVAAHAQLYVHEISVKSRNEEARNGRL
jgi:hypothetical protein